MRCVTPTKLAQEREIESSKGSALSQYHTGVTKREPPLMASWLMLIPLNTSTKLQVNKKRKNKN